MDNTIMWCYCDETFVLDTLTRYLRSGKLHTLHQNCYMFVMPSLSRVFKLWEFHWHQHLFKYFVLSCISMPFVVLRWSIWSSTYTTLHLFDDSSCSCHLLCIWKKVWTLLKRHVLTHYLLHSLESRKHVQIYLPIALR